MKYIISSFAIIATLSLIVHNFSAALPPGYEDQIYCPPDNCEVYINPIDDLGAASSFNKRYNPSTGETTDGVWTGSLTNANVTAPEGWIEPEHCTAEEYSECSTDSVESSYTDGSCQRYASSHYHPFNPHSLSLSTAGLSMYDGVCFFCVLYVLAYSYAFFVLAYALFVLVCASILMLVLYYRRRSTTNHSFGSFWRFLHTRYLK